MAEAAPGGAPNLRQPLLVRSAEWLGRALGKWRRGRTAKRDEVYIQTWKAAWVQGCEARWRERPREEVPHRAGAEHDAWLAGWAWGDTQPDRRDASRPATRAHPNRRSTDAGAKTARLSSTTPRSEKR
jgi:hypothetical protein